MKFKKKPVVIDAVLWDGNLETLAEGFMVGSNCSEITQDLLEDSVVIRTLEGDMRADVGDWIIRGVKGELYPCKPDIFALTYEAVEE